MDGREFCAARKRHHRGAKTARENGVRLRKRDGFWHIVGTLRVKGRKIRLRESTGFRATDEFREAGETQLIARVGEVQGVVIFGLKPTVAVAVAAHHYLNRTRDRGKKLSKQDIARIKDVTRRFGLRLLRDVGDADWIAYANEKTAGVAASTRERFLNLIVAFLHFARKKPNEWIDALPAFQRDKAARNPNRRKRRRVADLRPDLIGFMIEHASPHLKGQLVAEWSTGARVSSVLHGVRVCDLLLAPGRERLTFNDLKNGTTVDAALHPWAAEQLRTYVAWRGAMHDREAPLFLRQDKRTYKFSDDVARGTQNKTAFNAMKRRAGAALSAEAAKDETAADARDRLLADAKLVAQVTQHWFRHMLATNLLARTDGNLRMVMEQVGWLDVRSAIAYTHDVPELRRTTIASLEAPTMKRKDTA